MVGRMGGVLDATKGKVAPSKDFELTHCTIITKPHIGWFYYLRLRIPEKHGNKQSKNIKMSSYTFIHFLPDSVYVNVRCLLTATETTAGLVLVCRRVITTAISIDISLNIFLFS